MQKTYDADGLKVFCQNWRRVPAEEPTIAREILKAVATVALIVGVAIILLMLP